MESQLIRVGTRTAFLQESAALRRYLVVCTFRAPLNQTLRLLRTGSTEHLTQGCASRALSLGTGDHVASFSGLNLVDG